MRRREFLQTATFAALLARHGLRGDTGGLPPVHRITRGPRFHWFGYYDKFQFDPTGRFVLSNQVDFEHRSPRADDVIRVGMVDLQDNDRWIELGTTRAWNWQQGCMLQWIPGPGQRVMWNDREGGRFVCRVMDVKTREVQTLPAPVYTVSPDGAWGISPDFRRLNDTRPGYGYAGVPDPFATELAPRQTGLWKTDLRSGRTELVFSFADIAAISYENDPQEFDGAKHWFNHLLFNTDGSRFLFLHRWRPKDATKYRFVGGFGTRMFTCNTDGGERFVLDPHGKTSHFVWRDPQHVFAWAYHPSHDSRFYLFKDRTREVSVVGPDVMTVNGHNTYLPETNNEWVLNDTYPDAQRVQHPYLYHIPTNRPVPLGHFASPPEYKGEWRCDLHPRSNRDGTFVCLDSTHEGLGRQLYLIDLRGLVRRT